MGCGTGHLAQRGQNTPDLIWGVQKKLPSTLRANTTEYLERHHGYLDAWNWIPGGAAPRGISFRAIFVGVLGQIS